ncbi:MAG: tRNA lysidine(34) synthetase TilS [Planctomycetes bacterium]|nr:tRNA lysidine(34) synthetase TilS [Planctomycetota bacterium]
MTEERAELLLRCGRHPLAAEVARGLHRGRVGPGCRVMVAASGGADSTALLAFCAGLAERGTVVPVAAHVDHGLRPESPLDAEAARSASASLGVPFVARVLQLAPGAGVAARAREARYAALTAMARESAAAIVLTAHHADDQAETVLLALARGAGLDGIGGMPARRPMPCAQGEGVDVVRPCLRIARADLRQACVDLGLAWREDPGNDRVDTPRGAVRGIALPAVERSWPGAARRIARGAELARLGAALLESHVAAMRQADGSFARQSLRGAPEALAATAVRSLVGDRADDAVVWQAAEAAVDGSTEPRRFALQDGWSLVVDAHALRAEAPQGDDSGSCRQRV